jgi:hypothetical protein
VHDTSYVGIVHSGWKLSIVVMNHLFTSICIRGCVYQSLPESTQTADRAPEAWNCYFCYFLTVHWTFIRGNYHDCNARYIHILAPRPCSSSFNAPCLFSIATALRQTTFLIIQMGIPNRVTCIKIGPKDGLSLHGHHVAIEYETARV